MADDIQDVVNRARVFATEHLHALATQVLQWRKTGILQEGKLQELTCMLQSVPSYAQDATRMAEDMVSSLALAAITNIWTPIDQAPKDRTLLVNDTTWNDGAQWVAAHWLEGLEWQGWVYDDDLLNDTNPLGPQPTHYLQVAPVPDLAKTLEN